MVNNCNNIYSKDELNNIYEFLFELKWEHGWYKLSYEKGELQNQGLPINERYEGLAQYCKCFICRPKNFEDLRCIEDDRIVNLLNSN
jgi:hypothetical protein|tara:strand:+ start:66 stop:326 length:261 start_codon:yes stop_codon:yes gene_type:complete